jgi:Transposase DDE domain/Domain of unknown function (DUF4372)
MLAWAHGFDSTRVLSFATHRDTKEVKAVRHRSSVFHDVLKRVPWTAFDKLVDEHGSDEGTRSFTARQHLTALLFAQRSGAGSLREIEAAMTSHQGRLYHCGAVAPKRSTFADANRNRDFRVFSGLFEAMLAGASRGFRRKMADAVRLIDSTGLRLAGVGAEWARFSTSVFGAKAHVIYDPDHGRPVYHAVTAANVNDISAAKDMPIEAGATYVFDLGYYDFGFWAKLDALGCRLVTRFKANTPLNTPRDMPLPPGSTLLSDRIGFLPARQAMNRKNPMQDAVREIVVRTEAGETLRLLTNDLDAPAQEIADLYKRRWRIELFFRLMKQTLRIPKFIGRSENAVRIQIAVALIAYLLLSALQQIAKETRGFLELVRLVRTNLMHRKDAARLKNPPPPEPLDSSQLQLSFPST